MNAHSAIRPRLVVAALAAAAAPAFAQQAIEITSVAREPAVTTYYYTAEPATTYYYYAEPVRVVEAQPPIVVYGERLDTDQLITNDVVGAIASDRGISGTIGVETFKGETTLTGRTVTRGQADRAERIARSVDGVWDVHNHIRPRVGG